MCILCTGRNWCRRGAAMLPWLVIPLVGLWVLSNLLLPPRFRFEATSPRLACVLVLFATLCWYEVVVPRLSIWRARYSARLRERRLSQAKVLQKLRKIATRCCRNCLTPYRDQNPGGGGRFMCANCGHVSKRPILELATGGNLARRSGWICSQDWTAYGSGNWVDHCSSANVAVSTCKLLSGIFSNVWWVWRNAVMIGYLREDDTADKDSNGFSSKRGECGELPPECRGEKARRKAEEKRQARIEKEMLEEEERKQREEVAKLVEERRKLRDEMLEAEKESLRGSTSAGKRDSRKGAEKQRQESKKEKDKGSSKNNSDGGELEKRATRECEGTHVFDRKSNNEKRVLQKTIASGHIKGPFQSFSRGFSDAASVIKTNKPINGLDDCQIYGSRKGTQFSVNATGMMSPNGDDRKAAASFHRSVQPDVQQQPGAQKKSWLQLFTRSSAVSACPDANTTNCVNNNSLQSQSVHITDQSILPNYILDNQFNLGQSLSCTTYPLMNYSFASNPVSCLAVECMPAFFRSSRQDLILDDADIFEEPCFVPDPVSLLGPVSESLDNFPLDLGRGFVGNKIGEPHVPFSSAVRKPSPIECPLSRVRVPKERHSVPGQASQGLYGSNLDESHNTLELGTWQMWSSPLAHDGLGLVGGTNWFSPLEQNKSNQDDTVHSLLHDPMIPPVTKEKHVLLGTQTPTYQDCGICSPLGQLPDNNCPWVQRTMFQPLLADGDECAFPLNPNGSTSSHNSELPVKSWSPMRTEDCASHNPQDSVNSPFARPHIGGLYPANSDVQQIWSFN